MYLFLASDKNIAHCFLLDLTYEIHFLGIILFHFEMVDIKPPQTTAAKLRVMLAQENEIVVCPGVYDGFTARLALNAGFQILYMV